MQRDKMAIETGQGVQVGDYGHQTNIFGLFTNATPSLSAHIRSSEFRALVEERTTAFVGRDHVVRAIEAAFADPTFPSGYIILRGEPGIGKTALMSHLVKRWNSIHHFNISTQNICTVRDFLSNLCAQLIVRYNLDVSTLPPHATSDSGFLSELLWHASNKSSDQNIVIVVDALDESDHDSLTSGANCLLLPVTLPPRVYFVVSSREGHHGRLVVDREKSIYLREEDPHNLADLEAYIGVTLRKHRTLMMQRIAEWSVDETTFVKTLCAKSEGILCTSSTFWLQSAMARSQERRSTRSRNFRGAYSLITSDTGV
jgi:hypothetical protein